MARPTVGVFTDRLYGRLPELYRAADEADDWPLLRYLSTLLDQASDIEVVFDRIDYVSPADDGAPGDTSDLVDPAAADAAWLPWLAQMVGITVGAAAESYTEPYGALSTLHATYADLAAAYPSYGAMTETLTSTGGGELAVDELRDAIAGTSGGWQAGSEGAIETLVRPFLTGTQAVRVIAVADGDPWYVRVRTYEAETPEPWRIENALARPGVKPAGVRLEHEVAEGWSYEELAAAGGTYADLSADYASYDELDSVVPPP